MTEHEQALRDRLAANNGYLASTELSAREQATVRQLVSSGVLTRTAHGDEWVYALA